MLDSGSNQELIVNHSGQAATRETGSQRTPSATHHPLNQDRRAAEHEAIWSRALNIRLQATYKWATTGTWIDRFIAVGPIPAEALRAIRFRGYETIYERGIPGRTTIRRDQHVGLINARHCIYTSLPHYNHTRPNARLVCGRYARYRTLPGHVRHGIVPGTAYLRGTIRRAGREKRHAPTRYRGRWLEQRTQSTTTTQGGSGADSWCFEPAGETVIFRTM